MPSGGRVGMAAGVARIVSRPEEREHRGRTRSHRALLLLGRNPTGLLGGIAVLGLVLTAVLAPFLAPYDPAEQFFDGLTLQGMPLPPNDRFRLGTDLLGR